MFNCDSCGLTSLPKEKQNKVALTREKVYENYKVVFDPKTKKKKKEYFTTIGYETVSESSYCKNCTGEK